MYTSRSQLRIRSTVSLKNYRYRVCFKEKDTRNTGFHFYHNHKRVFKFSAFVVEITKNIFVIVIKPKPL